MVTGRSVTFTALYLLDRTQETYFLQTNGGLFYVPSKLGERLMLPVKYLEDLKSAPVHEVDFVATFIEVRRTARICNLDPQTDIYRRCLKVNILQWVVGPHCILAWFAANSTVTCVSYIIPGNMQSIKQTD